MPHYSSERRKLAALKLPPPVDLVELLERAPGGLLRRTMPAAPPVGSEMVNQVAGVFRRRGSR